jgi:hypothetical protein
MKNILKLFIIVILIANIQIKCIAQDSIDRKGFISVNSGIYLPSMINFNRIYDSHYTFINGISLGIPFTNEDVFFYCKVMYFQKSGTPIIYHFNSSNGVSNIYTTQEGDVALQQLLVNIGIQYNFSFELTNILTFNGGFSLIKASEKISNSPSNSESKASGFAGYFLGTGYEKRIFNKFGLFSEIQYNFDRLIFKTLDINYGGTNINIGIRYYFS